MPNPSESTPAGGLDRLISWSRRHRLTLDVLWACFWLLPCLLLRASGGPTYSIIFLVLTVISCAALAVRRVFPLIAVLVWLAAMIVHIFLVRDDTPLPMDWVTLTAIVATLAAAYTVQFELAPRWRRLFLIPLAVGPIAAALINLDGSGSGSDLIARAAALVMAWSMIALFSVLGTLSRARREELNRVVAHADLLEAQRSQEVELATLDERTRLAREMHDTVAHSLGVVIAQADGGRYAVLADPQAGKESLEAIAKVARESLAEMRRLVGTLRSEGRELTAAPKASDIDALVEDFRRAGLWIQYRVHGQTPAELAPTLSLTIFRLVQQSLSNALKHGDDRPSAQLTINWAGEHFELEVTNPFTGTSTAGTETPGHGLIGMLERARMLGGTLEAGPVSDEPRRWRVHALLPLTILPTGASSVAGTVAGTGSTATAGNPQTVASDDATSSDDAIQGSDDV